MTAAKVMDTISRLPGCAGQAADAVSAYTQVKMEDASTLLRIPKMMMKGRSPTMRHVSGPHRVAQNWLFDRMNLDCDVQIRYIDSKHQLAEILTKGNSTRDEWDNLLHLFNVDHFSSTSCAENSSLISCPKMIAKRT